MVADYSGTTQLVRDLEDSRVAMRAIAPVLYYGIWLQMAQGHPYRMTSWAEAPRDVKERLIAIAERAVRSVNRQNQLEAERKARILFRVAVQGAVQGVLDVALVNEPSRAHIIERVVRNVEETILSTTRSGDIVGDVLRKYDSELQSPSFHDPSLYQIQVCERCEHDLITAAERKLGICFVCQALVAAGEALEA